MKILICLLFGYALGCFHPAYLVSRKKEVDLRTVGTKNLGASNTLLVFGRKAGALVMLMDIGKAYLACRLARLLFPKLAAAGLLAGLGAILGHVYPRWLGYKGGKGLAAFAGTVLAYDRGLFLLLLVTGLGVMLLVNYSFALPISTGILFPVLVGFGARDLFLTLIAIAIGAVILYTHWPNIARALRGDEAPIRQILREKVFCRSHN